jgi:hypothetical protein
VMMVIQSVARTDARQLRTSRSRAAVYLPLGLRGIDL